MIVLVPDRLCALLRQFKAEDSGPKPIKIEVGHGAGLGAGVGRYAALSLTRECSMVKLSDTVRARWLPGESGFRAAMWRA